jgi:Domain of unknown function (DUF4192)
MSTATPHPSTVFTARRPDDLLAVVPAVLGFHPEESLVLLTFGGRRSFHARVDLPEVPEDLGQVADMLLTPALRQRPDKVLLIAYSGDAARAAAAALHVSDAFDAHGFAVLAPLRSDGSSWFHVRREEDPADAEPHPYDVRTHALTAQNVLEGRVTLASRAALAATLAADPDAAGEVTAAWHAQRRQRAPDQAELRALVASARAGDLSAHEVARLARACSDPAVRDAAWCDLRAATAEEHVELWRGVVVRTPDEIVAGVAAVLGFGAWLAGHGALAWCALDRSFAADPACSLARLVADLLEAAVPPTAWSDIAGSVARAAEA